MTISAKQLPRIAETIKRDHARFNAKYPDWTIEDEMGAAEFYDTDDGNPTGLNEEEKTQVRNFIGNQA